MQYTEHEMTCKGCNKIAKRNGKDRYGNQRYRCVICNKTFIEPKDKPLGNMYLSADKAISCIQLLVEGMSIRSIERVTNVNRNTILSLLETVGKKCLWIQENLVRNLNVKDIQADEIWSFVGMKDKAKHKKQITDEKVGTTYCFTAIEATSKLIAAWHLGRRTEQDTLIFLEKLADAVQPTRRFQMTTDSWKSYTHTVNEVLGTKVDYAQIVKVFGAQPKEDARYSAPECIAIKKTGICGQPDNRRKPGAGSRTR